MRIGNAVVVMCILLQKLQCIKSYLIIIMLLQYICSACWSSWPRGWISTAQEPSACTAGGSWPDPASYNKW